MTKMTNMQVTALAMKITNEINAERTKKREEGINRRKAFIDSKIRRYPVLQGDKNLYAAKIIIENNFKDELNQIFNLMDFPSLRSEIIKNDLIICTIELDNVEEVIAKMKAKYI